MNYSEMIKQSELEKEAWFWESDEVKDIRRNAKLERKRINNEALQEEIKARALPGRGAYVAGSVAGGLAGAYLGGDNNSLSGAMIGSHLAGNAVNNEYTRAKSINEANQRLNLMNNRAGMKSKIREAKAKARMEKKAELEKDAFIGSAIKAGIGLVRKGLQTGVGKKFAGSAIGKDAIGAAKNFASSGRGQAMRQGLMKADVGMRQAAGRVVNSKFGQNTIGRLSNAGFNNAAKSIGGFGNKMQRYGGGPAGKFLGSSNMINITGA